MTWPNQERCYFDLFLEPFETFRGCDEDVFLFFFVSVTLIELPLPPSYFLLIHPLYRKMMKQN